MAKRYVDCNNNELQKTIVYSGASAQAVTMYVPSKTSDFKEENYPDAPSDEPAQEFAAW